MGAFVLGRWSAVTGGCRYLPRLRGHPGELPVVPGCVGEQPVVPGARRPVPGAYTDVVPGCVREGPVVPGARGSGGAVVVKKQACG